MERAVKDAVNAKLNTLCPLPPKELLEEELANLSSEEENNAKKRNMQQLGPTCRANAHASH